MAGQSRRSAPKDAPPATKWRGRGKRDPWRGHKAKLATVGAKALIPFAIRCYDMEPEANRFLEQMSALYSINQIRMDRFGVEAVGSIGRIRPPCVRLGPGPGLSRYDSSLFQGWIGAACLGASSP